MAREIHGVMQQAKHFEYIARAARSDAKQNEVPTLAALSRYVQAEEAVHDLIASFCAHYRRAITQRLQRRKTLLPVSDGLDALLVLVLAIELAQCKAIAGGRKSCVAAVSGRWTLSACDPVADIRQKSLGPEISALRGGLYARGARHTRRSAARSARRCEDYDKPQCQFRGRSSRGVIHTERGLRALPHRLAKRLHETIHRSM